jgi:hypothetical protein
MAAGDEAYPIQRLGGSVVLLGRRIQTPVASRRCTSMDRSGSRSSSEMGKVGGGRWTGEIWRGGCGREGGEDGGAAGRRAAGGGLVAAGRRTASDGLVAVGRRTATKRNSPTAVDRISGIVLNGNSRDVLSLPKVGIMTSATKSLMGLCLPEVGKDVGSRVGKSAVAVSSRGLDELRGS